MYPHNRYFARTHYLSCIIASVKLPPLTSDFCEGVGSWLVWVQYKPKALIPTLLGHVPNRVISSDENTHAPEMYIERSLHVLALGVYNKT